MSDEKTIQVMRTVFLIDVILAVLVFIFSFLLRNIFVIGKNMDFFAHLALLPLLLLFILTFFLYFGAYQSPRYLSLMHYGWSVFRALFLSIALILMLLFVLKIEYVSRSVIVFFAILEFVAV